MKTKLLVLLIMAVFGSDKYENAENGSNSGETIGNKITDSLIFKPIPKEKREKDRMENAFKKIATGLFENKENNLIIFESKDKSWDEESLTMQIHRFGYPFDSVETYIEKRDWDNLFYMIAWDEHRGFMDELMESLAEVIDVNEREYDGMTDGICCWKNMPIDEKQTSTALVRAAPYASEKTIETLLNRKADVNYQEPKRWWTALHWATYDPDLNWKDSDLGVFKLLLNKGANLELKSNNGKTAYDFASIDPLKKLLGSWRWNQNKNMCKIWSQGKNAKKLKCN